MSLLGDGGEAGSSQCAGLWGPDGWGLFWEAAHCLLRTGSKINDCLLNILNHFLQHMFCSRGLKAGQIYAFTPLPVGLDIQPDQTV